MFNVGTNTAIAALLVVFSSFERSTCQRQNGTGMSEETQVGIFYGIGRNFTASELISSIIPISVRSMASCVQGVRKGPDMTELRDEVNYVIEMMQKNGALGPVMLEMEMIYTESTEALMAVPSMIRKPMNELSFDDLSKLRDAAFNLLVLPIRLNRLRANMMLALTNSDLYSNEMLTEVREHLQNQLGLAVNIGMNVLRCRNPLQPSSQPAAIAASTETPDDYENIFDL